MFKPPSLQGPTFQKWGSGVTGAIRWEINTRGISEAIHNTGIADNVAKAGLRRSAGHGNRHRTLPLWSSPVPSSQSCLEVDQISHREWGNGRGFQRARGSVVPHPCLPTVFSFHQHGLRRSRLKGHLCTKVKVSTCGWGQLVLQE